MKVRILVDRAGPGGCWKKGETVDLDPVEARSRIRRGHAEDPDAPKLETAALPGGAETAVTRGRGASRKGATTPAASKKKKAKTKVATRKTNKPARRGRGRRGT